MRRTYESDDADGVMLNIVAGGNGDYFLAVTKGFDFGAPAVRICTSGGSASRNPRVVAAVAALWRALGEQPPLLAGSEPLAVVAPDYNPLDHYNPLEPGSGLKGL